MVLLVFVGTGSNFDIYTLKVNTLDCDVLIGSGSETLTFPTVAGRTS